ncbi:MAG TPA: DUF4279 domain-containing protein [Gammaproteobacteria bacterium]
MISKINSPGERLIVRLKFESDLVSPEASCQVLDLVPTRAWELGDLRPNSKMRYKRSGWVLDREFTDRPFDLGTCLEKFIEPFKEKADEFRRLADSSQLQVSLIIYSATSPSVFFDRELLQWLVQLGLNLDIDMYMTE